MSKSIKSRDKVLEAEHFFNQMQEAIRCYFEEKDAKAINNFRYNLSAFVTAARSVTFVLQKQYRSKHGEKFDKWYKEKRNELKQFKFASLFCDLRNIVQKEGNRLPLVRFEFTNRNGSVYHITWDPTGDKQDGIVGFGVVFDEKEHIEFFPPSNASEEEIKNSAMQTFVGRMETIFSKDALESLSGSSKSLILNEHQLTISFPDFVDISKQYLAVLEQIVTEASKHFVENSE